MAEADLITAATTNNVEVCELMDTLSGNCNASAIAERTKYLTASAGAEPGSSSNCAAVSLYMTPRRRRLEQLRSECGSVEEYEIEKSRDHWTEVDRPFSEDSQLEIHNQQYFQRLVEKWRRHPYRIDSLSFREWVYGSFFRYYYGDALKVGRKIAEGGQAEIFEATIYGSDELVLKVFKSGFSLADFRHQWTFEKLFQDVDLHRYKQNRKFCCFVMGGTILKDGRFAFVMDRYWGDLRKLIDLQIVKDKSHQCPPFQSPIAIMLKIARGMLNLHTHGILHRDLKASNVLLVRLGASNGCNGIDEALKVLSREDFECYVADFESSLGVQGTGFWRAPEVLSAIKNRTANPEIWTRKVDVYSYAMTSYEVLTGCMPFGNLAGNDYDIVISGERPPLPDYIDYKVQKLLRRCWHSEPLKRPTFDKIVKELETLVRS